MLAFLAGVFAVQSSGKFCHFAPTGSTLKLHSGRVSSRYFSSSTHSVLLCSFQVVLYLTSTLHLHVEFFLICILLFMFSCAAYF